MDWYLKLPVQIFYNKTNMMKKLLSGIFLIVLSVAANAQYAKALAILERLEQRKGINKNIEAVNIDHKKFVHIKEFDDHTERMIISLNGKQLTYIELFDDKSSGETSSNVFSGDVVRTRNNMISMRADKLEGEKIAMPIAKTFLLTKQDDIIYLVDVNTRERWIDETAFGKK